MEILNESRSKSPLESASWSEEQPVIMTESPFDGQTVVSQREPSRQVMDLLSSVSSYQSKLNRYNKIRPLAEDELDKDEVAQMRRQARAKKVKDEKEIQEFAQRYAALSTTLYPPEEVKRKSLASQRRAILKDTTVRAKVVEYVSFPGFDEETLPQLPELIDPTGIWSKVIRAHPSFQKDPRFDSWIRKLLFETQHCTNILHDSFWWLFMEFYQSNKEDQPYLYNRIAANYVALLYWVELNDQRQLFRGPFIQKFPELLSQANYAIFIEAFPDSYKKFDDNFKEKLLQTLTLWTHGFPAVPEQHTRWQYSQLNTEFLKEQERVLKKSKKTEKWKSAFDELESLGSRQAPLSPSPSLNPPQQPVRKSIGVLLETPRSSFAGSSVTQGSNRLSVTTTTRTETKQSKPTESSSPGNAASVKPRSTKLKSHPVGSTLPLELTQFNVSGVSPLVAHYFDHVKVEPRVGNDVMVQRSVLHQNPNRFNVTYHDIIKERREARRALNAQLEAVEKPLPSEKIEKSLALQARRDKAHLKKILSSRREVKRLIEIIMIRYKMGESPEPDE